MVNLPDPKEVIKYVEAWQRFCDTYGDVVYNVLLSGQTAFFKKTDDRFLYERVLRKGEEMLGKSFRSEENFLKEIRDDPLL